MQWLIILAVVIGALVLLTLGLTLFFFNFAIRRNDKHTAEAMLARMEKTTPAHQFALVKDGYQSFTEAGKQDVYITSRDGLRLHGYLIEHPDRQRVRGTIILVHGWRSHPEVDFSASWQSYGKMDLDILAIHQRAHGKSEGKHICFGVKERFDLIDWVRFINERYGTERKVILSGISMGCSTVLMALGEDALPQNVAGATADCGFVSAWEEFAHVLRHSYHLPKFPLLYTTDLFSRAVADFPFRACSTEEALKKAKVPILFVHGLGDTFVPPEHTRRSAAACASAHEIIEIEGAGHGVSYLVDTQAVAAKLVDFIEHALG